MARKGGLVKRNVDRRYEQVEFEFDFPPEQAAAGGANPYAAERALLQRALAGSTERTNESQSSGLGRSVQDISKTKRDRR